MSSVVITGGGLLGGLASDLESALRRLSSRAIPALGPMSLDPEALFGERNYRPLDRTGRLATAAVQAALKDAALGPGACELGLVVGTMFGSVETIAGFDRRALDAGPAYAKPMDFANSVINAAAGQVAIWHGLRGMNTTVSAGTASGLQALGIAMDALRRGRLSGAIAGGVDEFSATVKAAVQGRNGDDGARIAPLCALSEAACFWVLETAAAAEARGRRGVLDFRGWATGHLPPAVREQEARAAAVAAGVIRHALAESAVSPHEVQMASVSSVGAAGRSTIESLAVTEVFGSDLPRVAVKELSGECLGASGALQILPAMALAHGHKVRPMGETEALVLSPGPVVLTAIDAHGPVTAAVVCSTSKAGS